MTNTYNPYENLCESLENRLTLVDNGREYNMYEYMLNKANGNTHGNLPVARRDDHSIVAVVNYVNERLTIKKAPIKEKTIKRFPLRTSFSALLSAVAACALIISCCIYAIAGRSDNSVPVADASVRQELIIEELSDIRN